MVTQRSLLHQLHNVPEFRSRVGAYALAGQQRPAELDVHQVRAATAVFPGEQEPQPPVTLITDFQRVEPFAKVVGDSVLRLGSFVDHRPRLLRRDEGIARLGELPLLVRGEAFHLRRAVSLDRRFHDLVEHRVHGLVSGLHSSSLSKRLAPKGFAAHISSTRRNPLSSSPDTRIAWLTSQHKGLTNTVSAHLPCWSRTHDEWTAISSARSSGVILTSRSCPSSRLRIWLTILFFLWGVSPGASSSTNAITRFTPAMQITDRLGMDFPPDPAEGERAVCRERKQRHAGMDTRNRNSAM